MFPEGRALEFLIVAIVALIVVGPKDLPVLLRQLGQFMAKLRGMAAEFRASFDEMARQSELDELRKEVDALRKGQLADIESGTAQTEIIDEIHRGLADVGVQLHPPMSYQYVEAPSDPAPTGLVAEAAPQPEAAVVAKPKRKPPAKKSAQAAKSSPPPAAKRSRATQAKGAAKPRAKKSGPKA